MPLRHLALAFAATLGLAACQDSTETAEDYYQSGVELLEAGDLERALVEFRNVFKYDGLHKDARRLYADTILSQGKESEAYSQYLRLIEQYPDTPDVRLTLAEIAVGRGDWAEVERHGTAAIELAPEDPRSGALAAALAYRTAVMDKDAEAEAEAVKDARAALATAPENLVALRIVIDALAKGRTPALALPEIDKALAIRPDDLGFNVQKFQIQAAAGQDDAAGAQLEVMLERFPDNEDVRRSLIGWYVQKQDFDAAETLLRRLAGEDTGAVGGHITLVQFLRVARGTEAAQKELDRLVAASAGQPQADLYRAMAASLTFESGDQTAAIASLQDILKDAEPSDQTRKIKVTLAQMLAATGDQVGARALVEEILAEDATNTNALKMRAAWLVSEDQPDAAINDLRTALDQTPRDPGIFLQMADAYERAGDLDLAGERMAMAVEVSGSGPGESIRYARFLLRENRPQAAESVLQDARRAAPANIEVLNVLADLWLQQKNWNAIRTILEQLDQIGTEQSAKMAVWLRSAMLMGQNQIEDGLALLEQNLPEADNAQSASTIVIARIRAGKLEDARQLLDDARAKAPDDPYLRLLDGSLSMMTGDTGTAEEILRGLIADHPSALAPVRMLYGLLTAEEREADAAAVLEAALAAQPENPDLLWIRAGNLEKAGDLDGAIAIYEDMYARNSGNMIIANNLASLLTTRAEDAESLERAYVIGRRLRGMDVPAFQDTYGWIESLRGNYTEALGPLKAAAEGLPEDPLVHYHLGMTQARLDMRDDAIATLTKALDLAGDSGLAQFETARATLKELQTPAQP